MSFRTEFGLLREQVQIVEGRGSTVNTNLRFQFECGEIKALTDHDGGAASDQKSFLLNHLDKTVPPDKRQLVIGVNMKITSSDVVTEMLHSVYIYVEGEVLKEIHCILCLGTDKVLALELEAELAVVVGGENIASQNHSSQLIPSSEEEPPVFFLDSIQLRPLIKGDGNYNLGQYARLYFAINQPVSKPPQGQPFCWKLRVTRLSFVFNHLRDYQVDRKLPRVVELNKGMFTEESSPDVEIVAKDGVIVPCYGLFLTAQSPVIEKMLAAGHSVEGATRKINMAEWTPQEVNGLLSFLYYGWTASAVEDASMSVSLFEIGDYFLLTKLKEAMKTILMNHHSAQSISVSVGGAWWIYHIAELMNDVGLMGKAAEALAIMQTEPHDDKVMIMMPQLFKEGRYEAVELDSI